MTQDFIKNFMTDNQIDWIKLIDFVSKRFGDKPVIEETTKNVKKAKKDNQIGLFGAE